jgi:hypothetical protein
MPNFRWLLLPVLLLGSDRAFAQDEAPESDRKVQYKQKTEIDFEDLEIDGVLQKPQGSLVIERKQASFNPLIKLRDNWSDKIEDNTDEIK